MAAAAREARLRLYSGLSRCTRSQQRILLWWRHASSNRHNATLSLALVHPYSFSTTATASSSSLPRILQPSLWKSAIPSFLLRRTNTEEGSTKKKISKPWNPATFFIAMSILIGSQAINTIALRNERDVFMRRADQRIAALKEVISKVEQGEWAPDGPEVKRTLRKGLNDEPLADEDWEATLKEIEEEELEWQAAAKERRAVWEQDHYEKGLKEEKKRKQKEAAEAERRGPFQPDGKPRPDYKTPRGSPEGERRPPSKPQSAKDYFG